MLTKLGRGMDEHSENFSKIQKNKSVPTRSHRTGEYNNLTEKYLLVAFNSSLDEAQKESVISNTWQRNSSNQRNNKKEKWNKNDDSLRNQSDNTKQTSILFIEVSEGKKRDKWTEILFEEIMVEKFPNLEKELYIQIQEAQGALTEMNSKVPTPKHVINKMSKVKKPKSLYSENNKKMLK